MSQSRHLRIATVITLSGELLLAACAPPPPPKYHGDVVILMVDQFGHQPLVSSNSSDSTDNCVLKPDSQAYHISGIGGKNLPKPHGQMIYDEYQWLLENKLRMTAASIPISGTMDIANHSLPLISSIADFQSTDRTFTITLAQLDMDYISSKLELPTITAQLTAAMKYFNARGQNQFVISMSFAIVPCEVLNLIQNSDTGAVNKFGSIYSENNNAAYTAYMNARRLDPIIVLFREDLNRLAENDHIILVAASGNWNLKFPFAPALWDGVLAVSAKPDNNIGFEPNSGDVMVDGSHPISTSLVGTSFAVPRVGVLAAKYLLKTGTSKCKGSIARNTDYLAPMKYAGLSDGDLSWKNLDLSTAALKYCSDFPVSLDLP